jgi:hypothetical protein
MDAIVSEPNGAGWIRDCILDAAAMARAVDRLHLHCREGVRHFSAIGKAFPLSQARDMERSLSRLEDDAEDEVAAGSGKTQDRPG